MTIQIPDPGNGIPEDKTGDNEHVMWLKVKDNFNNQTHAASKEVGVASGQIPLSEQTYNAVFSADYDARLGQTLQNPKPNCDNFSAGTRYFVYTENIENGPPISPCLITTERIYSAELIQYARGYRSNEYYQRAMTASGYSLWQRVGQTVKTYSTTTASGANVVVDSTGKLMRSTSSERYKDILGDLELDDVSYANAMQLAPIVYRSTADADNPDYHYYSFSAEALGAFDPAFTLWRDTEMVTDADGNTTEQPLAERVAEGININALLAFSHAIAIKQGKLIADQAEAIETLTKRIDDMTVE